MLKKITAGFLVFATSTLFGMSLNKLNSASKAELMEINGIGEVKAAAIIKERKKAKFKSFEDFQRVEGVGEQTAANVKNDVKSSADVKKVKKTTKRLSPLKKMQKRKQKKRPKNLKRKLLKQKNKIQKSFGSSLSFL